MQLFSLFRSFFSDLRLLLTNPTSFFLAIQLIAGLVGCGLFSGFVPVIVRRVSLPSSVETVVPLDMVFDTCLDQLHGVCSFPTGTVDLTVNPFFSPGIHYSIGVNLRFLKDEETIRLGLFKALVRISNEEGKKISEYHKTAYLKGTSFMTKAIRIFFFPLYLLGFFGDSHSLDVLFTHDYLEPTDNPSSTFVFQLQNRFAEIEYAEVRITAQFGLIRHILYWWPLTSFVVIYLCTFFFFSTLFVVHWGMQGTSPGHLMTGNGVNGSVSPSTRRKKRQIIKTIVPDVTPAEDEVIPENVDEIPECVPLIAFDSDVLRQRK